MGYMEEIKLPKFKTKEELEQFAMGLMTENESLKNVIKRKDATIKELDATADKEYYKKLYEKEHREHIATKIAYSCSEFELNKIKRKVHKLCSMVTYMAGLLPRFKAKRVKNVFGDFNIEDYRL